jgi:3-oxoacyl-[acyl-carrier-protein] synthase-3
MSGIRICSISSVYGNQKHYTEDKQAKATGIRHLYSLQQDKDAIDLGAAAAKIILNDFDQTQIISDNCALIFITQTPRYKLPSSAFLIAQALNKDFSLVFDVNLGCSAFPSALMIASSLLSSKSVDDVIVVIADTVHRISQDNPAVSSIFSDVGSAIHMTRGTSDSKFDSGTDGSGHQVIHCQHDGHINMSGLDVYAFAKSKVPASIQKVLPQSPYANESDLQIPVFLHQANKMINDAIEKSVKSKTKIDLSFPSTLGLYGNTAGSSIPITMCHHYSDTPFREFIASGFGVGLHWISVHWIQISPIKLHHPIPFQ